MNKKPEAFLSINKNRLKQYNSKQFDHSVYLSDGDEFEIELNNPTDKTYLARFQLNETDISQSGIVLRPGEHTYIRRFLDYDWKFKFETYNIPKSNKSAVKNNGLVTVKFYEERTNKKPTRYYDPWSPLQKPNYDPSYEWSGDTGNPSWAYYSSTSLSGYEIIGGTTVSMSTSEDPNTLRESSDVVREQNEIETGRVEKGGSSGQQFTNVNKDFEIYCSHTTQIKILPHSQKPREKKDIRVYCTNCGARFRENWKFCAHCGEKRP